MDVVVAPQLHARRKRDKQHLRARKRIDAIGQKPHGVRHVLEDVEQQEHANAFPEPVRQGECIPFVEDIGLDPGVHRRVAREIAPVAIDPPPAQMFDGGSRSTADVERCSIGGRVRDPVV